MIAMEIQSQRMIRTKSLLLSRKQQTMTIWMSSIDGYLVKCAPFRYINGGHFYTCAVCSHLFVDVGSGIQPPYYTT